MKRQTIALLSGLIFLAYGIFSQKLIFMGLGLVFGLIALKELLDSRSK